MLWFYLAPIAQGLSNVLGEHIKQEIIGALQFSILLGLLGKMQFTRLDGSNIQPSKALIKLFKCWSVLWNVMETIAHETFYLRRATLWHRRSFVDVGVGDELDDFLVVFPFVRILARVHLVQYNAKRINI